jgi:hypothetical protein
MIQLSDAWLGELLDKNKEHCLMVLYLEVWTMVHSHFGILHKLLENMTKFMKATFANKAQFYILNKWKMKNNILFCVLNGMQLKIII